VIVVQGPTHADIVPQIKKVFEGKQLIFSTWEGEDSSVYDEDDIVLYNQIPQMDGVANANKQKISTLKGLEKAQEMGYTKVLKWRSDMIVFDGEEFFAHMDDTKLNGYCWVEQSGGYITDYFFGGDIEDVKALLQIQVNKIRFPEQEMTKILFALGLDKKVNLIINKIQRNQNDIYWYSNEQWFSTHKNESIYKGELPEQWQS
jgi:hypothetical protein